MMKTVGSIRARRLTALLLAAALMLTSCGGGTKATTMHLKRTEGRVSVSDDGGKDVEPREDLGLYSGYGVDTRSESYAWIDLDEVKLTKLDQDSEIEIQKDGKALEIIVNEGSLFFNVTQPLGEDETMTIRTSSMLVGIRGTCGWVEVPDSDTMRVFLLEGKVRCEVDGEHETVRAGEMAVMTEDGSITVEQFTAADVPEFVAEEIEDDDDLAEAILDDSSIDIFGSETDDPLAAYAEVLSWIPNVAYAKLIDFETDGNPELLILSVGEVYEMSDGRQLLPVSFRIYRNDVEGHLLGLDLSMSLENTLSLVESDGRVFLQHHDYYHYPISPDSVRDSYYGSTAQQDGGVESWGAVDYIVGSTAGSIMSHKENGLVTSDSYVDMNEASAGELAEARNKYTPICDLIRDFTLVADDADEITVTP